MAQLKDLIRNQHRHPLHGSEERAPPQEYKFVKHHNISNIYMLRLQEHHILLSEATLVPMVTFTI